MNKKQFAVLAGAALLVLVILALPSRSDVNQASDLETLEQKIQRELAHAKAEWQKSLDELERRLPQQWAQLEAHSEKLRAALEERLARIKEKSSEEVAERAREIAERAREAAQEASRDAIEFIGDGDRGWLGVTIDEVTAEKAKELKLPAERGVLVNEVEAESPAGKAGLKSNDVITEFNGQRVEGAAQFRRLVRETPAGRTAQLVVWRDGRAQNVSVQVGKFRDHLESRVRVFGPGEFKFEMPDLGHGLVISRGPTLGISGEDLSGQLGNYFGAPDGEGVLVRDVRSGSAAEKAGLKAGDVITKVDGERVRSVGELREKLREKREKKAVGVSVVRKGAEMSFNVEVEQPRPQPRAPVERKRIISRRVFL